MAIGISLDPKEVINKMTSRSPHTFRESTDIWITFALHGIHQYPNAPEEVAYLRDPHRHLFKFKVTVSVYHDDREVEFHMLQNWCKSLYSSGVLELNHKSCEMLARELLSKLTEKYSLDRSYEVEVSEDGECGAVLKQVPLYQ